MDGGNNNGRQPAEYAQPGGLSSPHAQPDNNSPSEPQAADQPVTNGQYPPQGHADPAANPNQEYGMTPSSGPQGQFAEYAQQRTPPQQYQDARYQQQPPTPQGQQTPQQQQPGHPPMAHAQNPQIAGPSAAYPQQPPHNYGGYPPPEMHYQQQPPPMYRPGDYPPQYPQGYGAYPPPMMHAGRQGPPGGGQTMSTVYSFVPIPGTHQTKRPRRRFEEIDRMYKCGWNGCEKAYGTLNHLNAHVTMQAHGVKRTPEEFKEIRKLWKQNKKEADSTGRQDDDQTVRSGGAQEGAGDTTPTSATYTPTSASYTPTGHNRQLPPVGYAPAGGQHYQQAGVDSMQYPQYQQYPYPPQDAYPTQGHPPGPNGHDVSEPSDPSHAGAEQVS